MFKKTLIILIILTVFANHGVRPVRAYADEMEKPEVIEWIAQQAKKAKLVASVRTAFFQGDRRDAFAFIMFFNSLLV